MSNPLGLVYYEPDDDEDEEEDDDEEQKNSLAGQAETQDQRDAPLATLVQHATSSPSPQDDNNVYDDSEHDLDLGKDQGEAPSAGQSPVGRADAVDAATDGRPGSRDPSPEGTGAGADDGTSTGNAADGGATPEHLQIPEAAGEPDPEMQQRIAVLLRRQQETGAQIVQTMKGVKEYRNPGFMEKMVEHYKVFQYGTCFPADVFDTKAFPPEDYIQSMLKQLEEKRAARRTKKLGEVQPAARVHPANAPASAALAALAAQKRPAGVSNGQAKRSKWDRA